MSPLPLRFSALCPQPAEMDTRTTKRIQVVPSEKRHISGCSRSLISPIALHYSNSRKKAPPQNTVVVISLNFLPPPKMKREMPGTDCRGCLWHPSTVISLNFLPPLPGAIPKNPKRKEGNIPHTSLVPPELPSADATRRRRTDAELTPPPLHDFSSAQHSTTGFSILPANPQTRKPANPH